MIDSMTFELLRESIQSIGKAVGSLEEKVDRLIPVIYDLPNMVDSRIHVAQDACPMRKGGLRRLEEQAASFKTKHSNPPKSHNGFVVPWKGIGILIGTIIGTAVLTWFGKGAL